MVLDLLIVAILLILALVGAIKGFSKILCGLFTVIGCTVGVAFLTPQVAEWLSGGLGESITDAFVRAFEKKEAYTSVVISGTPSETTGLLIAAGVPSLFAKIVGSLINKMLPGQSGTVAQMLGGVCGKACNYAIAAILILITVTVFFLLLGLLLQKARSFKAFRFIDGFIGLVVLVAMALAVIWVIFAFIAANDTSALGAKMVAALNDTTISKALYSANPLANIFR